MMIKVQPQSVPGKDGVLFGKSHLCPYSIMLSFLSQEHHTSLLLAAAKHLTHFELILSQCAWEIQPREEHPSRVGGNKLQNHDSITIAPEQLPAPSLKDCLQHLVIAIASSRRIWVLATLGRLACNTINHLPHSKKCLEKMIRLK